MDRMKFLDLLDGALSETELTTLARQFAVALAAFPGATKRDRAREFLGYVQRQGRVAGLAEALVVLRPDLSEAVAHVFQDNDAQLAWLDQVSGSGGQTMQSAVTWRWPAAAPAVTRVFPPEEAAPGDATEPPAAPANPYTPGRAVADEAMFFGRDTEHAAIQQQLAGGAHVAIVAARTFGASSLLGHVARQAAAPWLVAHADLKDAALHDPAALLNAVWRQWWAVVKPGDATAVRTLAEFVTAARKLRAAGFRPLLCLDELEQMVWRPAVFDDNLCDAWHELGREGALTIALTAHVAPAELFAQTGYRTRFYELFRQFDLGLLDAGAARALITVPAERAGLAVPAGAADSLLAEAGPQPFYLQLAGLYLYEALAAGGYTPEIVARRFAAAAAPYWAELWDTLSPPAQSAYPTAPTSPPGGMAGRQLRLLANRGLLIADGVGYRPFSAGFAAWLRRLRAAGEAAAAVAVV